jgi:ABC-2 type transport system ATP-binding protein
MSNDPNNPTGANALEGARTAGSPSERDAKRAADASRRPSDTAGAMVTSRALVRTFDKVQALRGIDLEVSRGEMFGLIGPDGAGKTTFFRIVAGLLKPTSGTLMRDQRATFGLVPQRFGLYQDLSIDENLMLRARLYDVPDAEARKRAAELLELVGLSPFRQRLAGALSGGMKQKLALASALLTRPELLLLDEPTTGVDPLSRREFWKLLHQLHHDGLTILVSTPYMDEAEYASRIGFLDRGRLSALGTREEIVTSYPRQLVEVRTPDRIKVRARLASMQDVDDVSLFGTALHVRGADGAAPGLDDRLRDALQGIIERDRVIAIKPSLEDVFVLQSEAHEEAA